LRYTVKTLAGLSGPKSLDPTKRKSISFLRKKSKRLFKKHNPSAAEKSRLDELLEKAKLLSEKRNSYLHRAWSETPEGHAVLLGEGLQVEAAPSDAAIERVASDILALAKKINSSRLHGFIHEVMVRTTGEVRLPSRATPISPSAPPNALKREMEDLVEE
jgi:hypothetical protein